MSTIPAILKPQLISPKYTILPKFPREQKVLIDNIIGSSFLLLFEEADIFAKRTSKILRELTVSLRVVSEIDTNVRTDIVTRLFGPEAKPPTPFDGAVTRYFGVARKDHPDITPSKVERELRKLRRGRSF